MSGSRAGGRSYGSMRIELATLGTEYVRLLPTWSQILRAPDHVRGELLRALVVAVAWEREANVSRAGAVRRALLLLVVGLAAGRSRSYAERSSRSARTASTTVRACVKAVRASCSEGSGQSPG